MSIDKATLEKLSMLAKIELKEEEIPNYLASFNKLLGALSQLQQVDVSTIPVDIELHTNNQQYLRDDIVTEDPNPEYFQKKHAIIMRKCGNYAEI
jgi:aspartyl/glutamyl-tRNA(Asn/Gln) amidotransferase C subunit